jgi:hypothetical protein
MEQMMLVDQTTLGLILIAVAALLLLVGAIGWATPPSFGIARSRSGGLRRRYRRGRQSRTERRAPQSGHE